MQAAFGLAQLARLNSFIKTRAHNYKRLRSFFARYEEHFILPEIEKDAKVNWLAFPLTIRDTSPLDRNSLTRFLEDHKIQTRPLFSGNVLKHPAYDKKIKSRTVGKLTHSNYIMDNALLIGLHHGITEPMLDYMFEVFGSLLKKVLK